MTSHFNLALYPQDAHLASACVALAQANFKEQASEYLLGENAHPHVTLCQFQANEEQLESIWSAVEKLGLGGVRELDLGLNSNRKALKLRFHHFYIKPGFHFHKDKYWLGLAMSATAELMALQKALHTLLTQLNIESPTLPHAYFPHLTLARCHAADYAHPPQIRELPALDIWQQDFVFQVSLGRSNEYGAYLKRLKIL
jgi:2'-5' RNA ligase